MNKRIFYTSSYKEISKNKFLMYLHKLLLKSKSEDFMIELDLESQQKMIHGPRVHYYKYKNFLIIYGKFMVNL